MKKTERVSSSLWCLCFSRENAARQSPWTKWRPWRRLIPLQSWQMEVPSVMASTNASLHHHPLFYHLPLYHCPLHLQRRCHYCRPAGRMSFWPRRAVAAPPLIQRSRTPAAFLLPLPLSPPLACAMATPLLFLPVSLRPNPARRSARWSAGSLDKQSCSSLTCQDEALCPLCSSSWRETRRWVWGPFRWQWSLDGFKRSQ